MTHGVELLLVPGTPIPYFLQTRGSGLHTSHETYLSRRVLALRIMNGEANFVPGGQVKVKAPGMKECLIAFEPNTVFEIRKLPTTTDTDIKKNHVLCTKCVEFSGEGENILRKWGHMKFTCALCGKTWES